MLITPLVALSAGLGSMLAAIVLAAAGDAGGTAITASGGLSAQEWATPTETPSPTPGRIVLGGIAFDGELPTPTPTPTPPPRPTSPAGLRVWANGDSTSYFMSVAVLQMLEAQGAVPVQEAPEYKISSGLMTPWFFDWPAYLAAEMTRTEPDLVVFMVGANDANQVGSEESYRERVAAVMDQLQAPGRWVAWVGQPNMGRPDLAATVPTVNRIFAEEAAKRPWVIYVDAWEATSDESGNYAAYLPDETGSTTLMRIHDGVHFTPAGGRLLARAVIETVFGN